MPGARGAGLRLMWIYAGRCLIYNAVLSVLGGASLFAISLAAGDTGTELRALVVRAFRIVVPMTAILLMTGGQALALLAMRLFHRRELPFYWNAGVREGLLILVSWILALLVGAVALLSSLVWI